MPLLSDPGEEPDLEYLAWLEIRYLWGIDDTPIPPV
jgi:hypothetical protein